MKMKYRFCFSRNQLLIRPQQIEHHYFPANEPIQILTSLQILLFALLGFLIEI